MLVSRFTFRDVCVGFSNLNLGLAWFRWFFTVPYICLQFCRDRRCAGFSEKRYTADYSVFCSCLSASIALITKSISSESAVHRCVNNSSFKH
ncbi:hypothetical protein PHET_11537 [Paragonimus heterotremus]|uniref:Uncharacterized protein n=1 Tax=Paragonimus heterotremus TaxID=100268 RepID=A0A8J4SJZ5_9TREM|nr:hypothetical protein PHET_11537 [Paragonimus heterotremus]